jgi:DUF1680 family protein
VIVGPTALAAALLALPPQQPQQPQQPPPPQAPVPSPPLRPLPLRDLHLDGWLGNRIEQNRAAWLDRVDLDARLEPYVRRPAKQAWAGEHVGKWLSAAAMAWQNGDDELLRARLDATSKALQQTQEEDGYLGTYRKTERFQLLPGADWDVWTIKYAMLGLLDVYAATNDEHALAACRRAANLLCATFGPGRRDILRAGTHVGMAATSVLEPVARLYAVTNDDRYLQFARYLVDSWDEPGGPRIAAGLREHGRVARIANGKAYEMLSNLVGLCELARATNAPELLAPAQRAFDDIVQNELLPTGSMSSHEHFTGGGRLPAAAGAELAETCVTVTWLQLCRQLFEATGEAKYGRELERTICNHLLAAQRPDGAAWCYFTPLLGRKPYEQTMTCCSSSGPRGVAMIPRCAALIDADGRFVLNLPFAMHGDLLLGSQKIGFDVESDLPRAGGVRIRFLNRKPAPFAVRLRLSEWAVPATVRVGAETRPIVQPGYFDLPSRLWQPDEEIELQLHCAASTLRDPNDPSRLLLQWGPCVLALAADVPGGLAGAVPDGPARLVEGAGLAVEQGFATARGPQKARFVPFADVGGTNAYRVWLPAPAGLPAAAESRSRSGNVDGSIIDGDGDTLVVTFDGKPAAEDWFAIAFATPQRVQRITFAHGQSFHDGGWFDCARGRPRVQVRAAAGAPWQTVGELADYPATTATDSKGLRPGQRFTLHLAAPVTACEVRVVGEPACGDNARQAFSSCGELTAQ